MDIKIQLRDINPAIIQAWQQVFINIPNIRITQGHIFDVTADAIVSPANSFGYMDGGIDLIYSKHFGWDLQKRLQKAIGEQYDGELPIGQAIIIPTGNPTIPYLISTPTMRIPTVVSDTINAYLAFRAALQAVRQYNKPTIKIKSILCPGLGTAVGEMPPILCAKQMLAAYKNIIQEGPDYINTIDKIFKTTREMTNHVFETNGIRRHTTTDK